VRKDRLTTAKPTKSEPVLTPWQDRKWYPNPYAPKFIRDATIPTVIPSVLARKNLRPPAVKRRYPIQLPEKKI
jgi:hypothetical protein